MNLSFLESMILNYLRNHPEVVEQLVDALVKRLVGALTAPPPSA